MIDLSRILFRRDDIVVTVHGPLRLDECCQPAPDVVVFDPDVPQDRFPTPKHTRAIVEVAGHTLARDRRVKGPLYARAGVPEYWIVDLRGERVEVHREPSEAGYRVRRLFVRGESLSPAFASDLSIEVDAILGPADTQYDDEPVESA